jgi:hypothetical protein
MSKASLIESGGRFSWIWDEQNHGFDCLLWPTAHSAVRLSYGSVSGNVPMSVVVAYCFSTAPGTAAGVGAR